jgi:hypothetical protein
LKHIDIEGLSVGSRNPPRESVRRRLKAHLHAILGLQPMLDHLELELADRAENQIPRAPRQRTIELDRALLSKLLDFTPVLPGDPWAVQSFLTHILLQRTLTEGVDANRRTLECRNEPAAHGARGRVFLRAVDTEFARMILPWPP